MYLIDPVEVTNALGVIGQGANGSGSLTTDMVLAILDNVKPAIEGAMNVDTLDYISNQEYFRVNRDTRNDLLKRAEYYRVRTHFRIIPERIRFRLSNGLIDPATVTVTDPDGNPVPVQTTPVDDGFSSIDYQLDAKLGIVSVTGYIPGDYTVTYNSGLQIPAIQTPPVDPSLPVIAIGTPQWMKSAIIANCVLWLRTTVMSVKVPTNMSLADMESSMKKRIQAVVYSAYQRPRADCYWPDWSQAAPTTPGVVAFVAPVPIAAADAAGIMDD